MLGPSVAFLFISIEAKLYTPRTLKLAAPLVTFCLLAGRGVTLEGRVHYVLAPYMCVCVCVLLRKGKPPFGGPTAKTTPTTCVQSQTHRPRTCHNLNVGSQTQNKNKTGLVLCPRQSLLENTNRRTKIQKGVETIWRSTRSLVLKAFKGGVFCIGVLSNRIWLLLQKCVPLRFPS